ncbi:hypothetical protein AAFF_G00413570 [Aldrovandia affinis]|uniref:Secreted protein n=1 Tax=Aldrovandia affinis TaxID=143900 RepID=A0AAD7SB75_9TELE|nr:hypothetical protein AAFF_G00413570 [Aldrovandia affinis]
MLALISTLRFCFLSSGTSSAWAQPVSIRARTVTAEISRADGTASRACVGQQLGPVGSVRESQFVGILRLLAVPLPRLREARPWPVGQTCSVSRTLSSGRTGKRGGQSAALTSRCNRRSSEFIRSRGLEDSVAV